MKLRAWDSINKRMIYDRFFVDSEGGVWYDQDPNGVDISGRRKIAVTDRLHVMQYTGLNDKYGKEIYEGDIVQFKSTDSYEYMAVYDYENLCDSPINTVVEWNESACGFRLKFQSRFKILKNMLELVGNIYETPNLIPKD